MRKPLLAIALVIGLFIVCATDASAATIVCTTGTDIFDGTYDNLVVPSGSDCVLYYNGLLVIKGDLIVEPDATFSMYGIYGDMVVEGDVSLGRTLVFSCTTTAAATT